jgi:hypothetical protein
MPEIEMVIKFKGPSLRLIREYAYYYLFRAFQLLDRWIYPKPVKVVKLHPFYKRLVGWCLWDALGIFVAALTLSKLSVYIPVSLYLMFGQIILALMMLGVIMIGIYGMADSNRKDWNPRAEHFLRWWSGTRKTSKGFIRSVKDIEIVPE